MSDSHYRPDVDGLRGVAVLLVLCYHAELGFPGGFLGVNVFFVISGYLITNLTLRELAKQRFSLGQFWLRRIRRILPACLVMLAGSLAIGAVLLLPADLVELSQSATAHLLMVANAFFWRKTDYFDGSVALKPLLHMWSLAVEEQFYLLFPLCLKWLTPVNRKRTVAFVCIFAGSLLVGLYGHIRHPSAAFYLLPFRAWELLLGCVICLIPATRRADKRWHSFAGPIGLFGILLCAAVPQPMWGRWLPPGLIPCLCTAALLLTTGAETGFVSGLLRLKPLVGVGKISYSLYLWHWPVLAFLKHLETDLQLEVGGTQYRILALLFSFALAVGSYLLIEQPIRKKVVLATSRALVGAVGGVALACLTVSCALIGFHGMPGRFDAEVLKYAGAAEQDAGRFVRTMKAADLLSQDLYACGPKDADTTCLVWGDSHAMCLLTGLEALADRHAVRLDQATRYATAPLLNFDHLAIWRNDGASEFCEKTLQLIEKRRYDCVLLVAAWESYLNWPSFQPSLQATLDRIHQYQVPVVFVLPIPDQGVDVPMVLASSVRWGRAIDGIGVTASDRQMRIQPLLQFLKQQSGDRIAVVDPVSALTDNTGVIRAALDGESLYSDHQHLSWAGSRRVAPIVMDQLLPLIRKAGSYR